ncbi:MAG: hypothetical protein NTW05_07810, partial [Pseudonocardiales bacterium]|nr:hypothetical protein [Pseudonocardiales bacterium]
VLGLAALVAGRDDAALHRLAAEVEGLAERERFEDAARRRDRLAALVVALGRTQRLAALAAVDELVGARPDGRGGWEVAVLRHGRLAAAGTAPRGTPPMPVIDALRTGAQTVLTGEGPLRGAPAEEVGLLHRWLSGGGTRLVHGGWSEPARGALSWGAWAERARPVEVPED